jgi:hypothetical protein
MIKTITRDEFHSEFIGSQYNVFTYEGKNALFDYLEEYENESGEKIELDIIAFACEYTEYTDLKELQGNYPSIKSMDDLRDNTEVIEIPAYVDNGGETIDQSFIIANF